MLSLSRGTYSIQSESLVDSNEAETIGTIDPRTSSLKFVHSPHSERRRHNTLAITNKSEVKDSEIIVENIDDPENLASSQLGLQRSNILSKAKSVNESSNFLTDSKNLHKNTYVSSRTSQENFSFHS